MRRGAAKPGHQIAKYAVADDEMAAGSTLGSARATLVLKATGAIEKMYAPEHGFDVFGTLVVHHWDALTGVPLTARRGTFEVFPEHQKHVFTLSNGVRISETVFLLNTGLESDEIDPPVAYYWMEIENATEHDATVGTYASVRLRGNEGGCTYAAYDSGAGGFVATSDKQPDVVRVALAEPRPDSATVTLDSAKSSARFYPGKLAGECVSSNDDPIGIFHYERRLRPGERVRYVFSLTFGTGGRDGARACARLVPDADDAFERTVAYYEEVMGRAIVFTPDDQVNRGVLWAKANVLRVQNHTQQGRCFVNDPTRSNNSVARDTAWYAFGADFLTPSFTREALLWYLDHLEPSGMVVEYYDIRTGKTEDYGLNVNDDSPLLILAFWHHYCVTGDRALLEYAYTRLRCVADFFLSQRNGDGLIWCQANGTADWGIVGWRNVIKGYRLSGATTEVNSECYAALCTMSRVACALGDPDKERHYAKEASTLKDAINEHLLDKSRNLYYLNIDLDGTPRTDVTCDLVFPVLFGVAEHDVAANIIARLSSAEFWSDAGMHTVPRNDINYGPTHGYGLLGGVWGGPTFWFASAASDFNPQFMAYALSSSFAHYTSDPRRNNTVPGQFCEWLHGETLTNQGMMLSPWFAPKYLWAALEGAAGLELTGESAALKPKLGVMWPWIAARDVRVHGKPASWVIANAGDVLVYATREFEGVDESRVYEEDVSERAAIRGDSALCVALRRKDSVLLFVGNTFDRTIEVGLIFDAPELRGKITMRVYNGLRREWIEEKDFDVTRLARGLPMQVSRHGFCILELHTAA